MTVAACLEAVALVVVVFLLLRHSARAEEAWAAERRELLNRVQRPEFIPVAPAPEFVVPEREPDEWGKVGQVDISDKWLNGDD